MANNKQLIIVVEGSTAMAPHWGTIVSKYLDKIIRSFCPIDMIREQSSSSAASGSRSELALIMFNACSAFLIQRSDWTRNVNEFFVWLSSLSFSGGEIYSTAAAEGLAEALMMFAIPQNGYKAQQNLDGKRHCILVSASDPSLIPRQVYHRPAIEIMEQSKINEAQPENPLYDAKAVATWFGQCSVSLSVICPKKLKKLKAIYNAANPNQRISEPVVDIIRPDFLVLISDGFSEARAALSRQRNSSNFAPRTIHVPSEMLSVGMNNSKSNMAITKHGQRTKCNKIWEGGLAVKRGGQPEFIATLEGFRNYKASETLAANWPSTMYIDRYTSQDVMNKHYVSEAEFLIFKQLNEHVVFRQMQENKKCAVIQLPSQTLLLSVTDKPSHLIAKLFPTGKLVFNPLIPTQVTQQHQEQQLQQQQQQTLQQQHDPQLQQYQFQQLQQPQFHSLQQQMMQYQPRHQPSMQLEQQQQEQQSQHQQQQALQQQHHPQLQQYQFQQLQQPQFHSLRQQMMQYQPRHQPSMQLEQQQQEQQSQHQQQHHPQLQQYQFQQLQQRKLHSMQQQMMQYQLRHQPPMQLEQQQQEQQSQQQQQQQQALQQQHHPQLQQQQISQPRQIVDDGTGHGHMAKKSKWFHGQI